MRKDGPTPDELSAFRDRCEKELGFAGAREKLYQCLAWEAGMSVKGVKKWFMAEGSSNRRDAPYSVWRLWHLVLFKEDVESPPA